MSLLAPPPPPTCTTVSTADDTISGDRILSARLITGWEFESDMDEEVAADQDDDYMYFGYWLQFPEDASIAESRHTYSLPFPAVIKSSWWYPSLTSNEDDPLRAIYNGGAAGRYVTRNLRIKNQVVDPQSPGENGRFTAKATLTADFGMHEDFAGDDDTMRENTQNTIYGDITEFKDGSKALDALDDFKVELESAMITQGDGTINGTTKADFSKNATGVGEWSGQFFGPSDRESRRRR